MLQLCAQKYIQGQKLQEGKPEKHPDPAGIGSGKESTPVPGYINDCCLLDYGDYVNTCTNGEACCVSSIFNNFAW